jgi:heterotetrameric sarcosine oxidase gamma subunit
MVELARRSPWTQLPAGVTEQAERTRVLLAGDGGPWTAALPRVANATTSLPGVGRILWLRPDRWLLLAAAPIDLPPDAIDVSSRYAGVTLRGARAIEAIAGGCSLDLREQRFAAGTCAQSRIEQLPAILLREAADAFTVMVERPLAHWFERWLHEALRSEESDR